MLSKIIRRTTTVQKKFNSRTFLTRKFCSESSVPEEKNPNVLVNISQLSGEIEKGRTKILNLTLGQLAATGLFFYGDMKFFGALFAMTSTLSLIAYVQNPLYKRCVLKLEIDESNKENLLITSFKGEFTVKKSDFVPLFENYKTAADFLPEIERELHKKADMDFELPPGAQDMFWLQRTQDCGDYYRKAKKGIFEDYEENLDTFTGFFKDRNAKDSEAFLITFSTILGVELNSRGFSDLIMENGLSYYREDEED